MPKKKGLKHAEGLSYNILENNTKYKKIFENTEEGIYNGLKEIIEKVKNMVVQNGEIQKK